MNIYFLTITSGFLMALSLTFDFLWPLAWIGLTPYLYIVFNYSLSKKESLKVGFLYGTTYYLVLLHWLFELYPLDNYGFNKIQSILLLFSGWIFISIYEGLWLSLVPLIFSRIKINPKINIFSFGAIWIIVEWGQQLGLLGFSWGRLAISQGKIPLLIQSASLLGSLLISFFIVSVNSCITYIFIYRKNILNIRSVYISLSSMIIFNIAYGSFNLNKNSDASKLTFAIIQGNISSSKKWTSDLEGIFKKYKDLSYEALNNAKGIYDKIDFILWPETAIPVTLNNNEKILKEYKFLASTSSAELIVGAYHEEGDNSYNSIYNISPSGKLSAPYFKRHLVPFGEYLPFENILSKLIPSLKQINLFSSNLTAGHKVNLLSSSHGKLGGLICFESTFPHLARCTTISGARILLLVTNDSWFKDSKAINQHLKQAVLRAVENNRYVIRSANTGISACITNKGIILSSIPPLQSGYIIGMADLIDDTSFYLYFGDIIVFISIFFTFFLYIYTSKSYKLFITDIFNRYSKIKKKK